MSQPVPQPLGFQLARTTKAISRAFDDALNAAGGSRSAWLVLLSLRHATWDNQADLARALDISGPTLTHHLDSLEEAGLVVRRRDPDNRRAHIVELTTEGEAMFDRLRHAALAFDDHLRRGLSADEVATLRGLLARMHHNVDPDESIENC